MPVITSPSIRRFLDRGEYFATVHAQVVVVCRARAAVDVEKILEAAVGADARGENAAITAAAALRLRLEHDGAGAIAEQHAGAAIVPVEDARERFRANHQARWNWPVLRKLSAVARA
jgi:hypothetical protein